MARFARLIAEAVTVACTTIVLAACTPESDVDQSETPVQESTSPSAPAPPDPESFQERASQMATWENTCDAMGLEPLAGQFAEVEAVEYQPGDSNRPEGLWNGSCSIWLDTSDGPTIDAVYAHIEAFETNTLAFEYFHNLVISTPEVFSDAAIDQEFSLGPDSGWEESRVTAQETPTTQSAERVQASASLLGDFYTVQLLVRFRPGEATQADCESEECVMTATSMAEFLATSGFLEDLHGSIESSIDGGA